MSTEIRILVAIIMAVVLIFSIIFWYYKKRGWYYPFRKWVYVDPLSSRGPSAREVYLKYRDLARIIKKRAEFPRIVQVSLRDWQILLSVLRGLRKKCDESPKNQKVKTEYRKYQVLILEILILGIELSWKDNKNHFLLHTLAIWELSCKVFPQDMLITLLMKEASDILVLTDTGLAAERAKTFVFFYDSRKFPIDGLFCACYKMVERLKISFSEKNPSYFAKITSSFNTNTSGATRQFNPNNSYRKGADPIQRRETLYSNDRVDGPSMFKSHHELS